MSLKKSIKLKKTPCTHNGVNSHVIITRDCMENILNFMQAIFSAFSNVIIACHTFLLIYNSTFNNVYEQGILLRREKK